MTNTLNKIIHNGDEYEFPSGEVGVSDQANNIFTPWMKIWGWTQSDYQSLTPDSNTAYLLLADQPTPWRLPAEYQEVEWIGSSWTQRIDTWINPNDYTYWFECKFNITNTSWDWGIMMACDSDVNSGRFGLWGYSTSNFQAWVYWTADNITTITPATWVDYTAIVNYNWDGDVSINWNVYSTLSPQLSVTYNTAWTIFCFSYGTGSYERYWSFKLCYMKIWHWTTLERELIPCYRKLDDEIWLYDLVNDTFYTNDWTWAFTKWPDVN